MYNPFQQLDERLERIEKALSQPAPAPETLLSKKELCEFLGISPNTLDKYIKDKAIPAYGIGSRIVFKRNEILNCLTKVN